MVGTVYVANVVVAALATGLCLSHAAPHRDRLALFGTALVYGVLLEQLVIRYFEAYRYSVEQFLLVVGDVPVVIGVGWAVIIYTGVQFGRRFEVGDAVLPLFVAVFALHIDLAIDAIAIRIPFWTWAGGGPWFGVPLSNFVGWFLVASLFTGAWVALERRGVTPGVRAVASIPIAVVGLIVLLEIWGEIAHAQWVRVGVLVGAIVVSLALIARDGPVMRPVDPRIGVIPTLFHGFYLAILLGFGMYRGQPLLLAVSLGLLLVGGLLHVGTVTRWRSRRSCRRRSTTFP